MTEQAVPSSNVEMHPHGRSATTKIPMKRVIWAFVIGIPIVFLLATGFGRDPNAIVSPLINKSAPHFTLRTLGGSQLSLSSSRGHPIVLNFWASWCLSCRVEHPYLVAAWHHYAPRGVDFIGVVYEDAADNARAFMKQYGGGWTDVMDPVQQTAINYGVYGPPETFFIDRGGVIRFKSTGPVTPSLLTRDINALLTEKNKV